MQQGLEINHREIEQFREQLDSLIPDQINGIEFEVDFMVRFQYEGGSIQLEYLEASDDPLTPYYSGWTFIVQQNEMCGVLFIPSVRHLAFIEIPIAADGTLLVADIDFFGGLKPAMETYA